MNSISFEEHRQIQTDILKFFADYCEKNSLKYFLAYGTLIGAVRHHGFIPWDDDTDVWMPRADYEKLIATFNRDNPRSFYQVISPFDQNAKHTYVKLIHKNTIKKEANVKYNDDYLGIDIDIFPLDGEPTDTQEYSKWYKKLLRLYRNYYYSILKLHAGSIKRRIKVFCFKSLAMGKKEVFLEKAEMLHKKYPYETADYVGSICCLFSRFGDRFEKKWFESATLMEYEGALLRVPCNYDAVLNSLYGDYMKLPPIEQQVTHHANNVFWKENP